MNLLAKSYPVRLGDKEINWCVATGAVALGSDVCPCGHEYGWRIIERPGGGVVLATIRHPAARDNEFCMMAFRSEMAGEVAKAMTPLEFADYLKIFPGLASEEED